MFLDEKNAFYKNIVKRLLKKCQNLQTENERLVLRINKVRGLIRRRTADVAILKRRLDTYNDGWRVLPVVVPHPKRKIEQKRGPKPKVKDVSIESIVKIKKPRKQRIKKETKSITNPPFQIPANQISTNPISTNPISTNPISSNPISSNQNSPISITPLPKTSKVGIMNINPIPPLPYHKLPVQPVKKPSVVISDSLQRLLKSQNFTIKH